MEFLSYQNQAKRITHYAQSGNIYTSEQKTIMLDLLGNQLYDIAVMCFEYGITLESVALHNIAKLRKHQRDHTE